VNRYLKRARPLAAFLAIALCSVAALPAVAAEPVPARPLAAAADAAGPALSPSAVAQATQAPKAAPAATAVADQKPFFKTTKGVLAVVLTGATLGFMGYSMSHDRVKSPAK
jgi:hypothetical protein